MAGKKHIDALKAIERNKAYNLAEACTLLQKTNYLKFDASVDIAVRLNVDPRQANQMVRGTATLPNGTGKDVTVLVLTGPENEAAAKEAGAEHVGLDEYLQKIQGGWTDIDVIICSPDVMPKVGKLGKVLGPRGLMPNPKSGTVTKDVAKAVQEVKAGKIDFRVDKAGIIHTTIGKMSFDGGKLDENATELLQTLNKLKPTGAKEPYIRSIYLSSTMGPGIQIDKATVQGI